MFGFLQRNFQVRFSSSRSAGAETRKEPLSAARADILGYNSCAGNMFCPASFGLDPQQSQREREGEKKPDESGLECIRRARVRTASSSDNDV